MKDGPLIKERKKLTISEWKLHLRKIRGTGHGKDRSISNQDQFLNEPFYRFVLEVPSKRVSYVLADQFDIAIESKHKIMLADLLELP